MSIINNGKKVAGSYSIAAATDATEEKKGIIRIATDEEAQAGIINDAAVTPNQLAQFGGGEVDTSNLVTLDDTQEIIATKTFKNANCGVQIANNMVDIGDTNFGTGIAFQSNTSPTEFSIVGRGFSGNSLNFKYFDGGIKFSNNINFNGSIYDKEGVEIKGGGADLTNYYTKEEIDTQIGDINTILDEINGEEV